jgi:drug/metabolite transporter (DMT)-like permease
MVIAAIGIGILLIFQGYSIKLPFRDMIKILAIGLIVAIHWISFFGAIKLSNISVALGCLASSTLFTSLLEPFILKRRLKSLEVLIGFMIIVGLYMIFRFETHFTKGIIVAIISAFLASLFSVLNKKLIIHYSTRILSFYEMIGGFIAISLFLLFSGGFSEDFSNFQSFDILYLLILGIICTAFAFAIQVDIMKKLSAYIVALTINLEPIYGIILAFFIFGDTEYMSSGFYMGTSIILLSVFLYPVLKKNKY